MKHTYLIYYREYHKKHKFGENLRKYLSLNKPLNSKENIELMEKRAEELMGNKYIITLINAMEIEYEPSAEYVEI